MKKNKTIFMVLIIGIVAFVFIGIGIFYGIKEISFDKNPETIEQCAIVDQLFVEDSNYEHNNLNYELDRDGNRINNSSNVKRKHENIEYRNSIPGLYVENVEISSNRCDEARATFKGVFTNNTGVDITNAYIFIQIKDENGEIVRPVFEEMPDILNGETKELEIITYTRIIDAYDFDFSYMLPSADDEQP